MLNVRRGARDYGTVAVVYASPAYDLRKKLWMDLTAARYSIRGPWVSMGDFNTVLNKEEVSNPDFNDRRCVGLRDWIFSQGLMDIGFKGPPFTWIRGAHADSFRGGRLDIALANIEWCNEFRGASLTHLQRVSSDHAPMLMKFEHNGPKEGLESFKFQAMWFSYPDFQEVVRDAWKEERDVRTNAHGVAEALKEWNKKVFCNINARKRRVLARLEGVQRKLAGGAHKHLIKLDRKLREEMEEVLYHEEIMWFQKSREQWITSGDHNTSFYHAATLVRRGRSRVEALKDEDGMWISDLNIIKGLIRDYYNGIFSKDNNSDEKLTLDGAFPEIPDHNWSEFNATCSREEIPKAVFDMAPFKAPGPDGLGACFYQKTWNTTGETIVKEVKQFFETGSLDIGLNETSIVLIPKVTSPENVKQFRPISLCNVPYKIITKVITNRLQKVMTLLIGPMQSSFVKGRQISDNIVIYQKALHAMRNMKRKKGMMMVKVDLEKAYDRLSWEFIRETLREAGLRSNWVRNIMRCITTARMSIRWNGEALEAITPTRGIRQGDPMSPHIFVLCVERLSQMITEAERRGSWKGIHISRNGPSLTHLLFADNMILFGEATETQLKVMMDCFDIFCRFSGQRVNYAKSSIFFSKNVGEDSARALSSLSGIPWTTNLGKYLGVSSGHGRMKSSDFNEIMNRIRDRLDGWKMKTLALAGRKTLAQEVLSTLPLYGMQTTAFPLGVCLQIEKLIRNFIWGGNGDNRRTSLVRWEEVVKMKHNGGLGIKCMNDMNKALLAKLGWRLI